MSVTPKELFLSAYDRYADAIYKHCFFRVFSRARAEELVQEAYLKTWQYLQTGKIENIRAFLYKVANNLIVDESRKRKGVSLDKLIEEGWEIAGSRENDQRLKAEFREVMDGLKILKPEERELIIMRYVDNFGPKEIAEITGNSANGVSVKLSRATEKLRKSFNK